MSKIIGIRHEDKYLMERRVAIVPEYVKKLKEKHGLEFIVEHSDKRVYSHEEFEAAGAKIVSDLSPASVIFGVKEMPLDFFETGKTYIFFSHTIKGQEYNMPLLKKMMEKKINLIDYEKVADDKGRRLIFFGRYAGLAGMINSLWSLGMRLKEQGIETPFSKLRQSHTYASLDEAKVAISEAGREIAFNGLPKEICPLTIGYTGYGNVSNGAQEIAGLLPIMEITPAELLELQNRKDIPNNVVYKIIFKESDLAKPRNAADVPFVLQDYYQHPEKYESDFDQYIPHLSILMNCMYWDDRYPYLLTKDHLEELYRKGETKLTVVGDVTCDPNGSIQCTHKGTAIEDPVFVYNPLTRKPSMGFKGEGLLVMAVDILPSEWPRDSSMGFSTALFPYVNAIAKANYNSDFSSLDLPMPIKRALILHQGKLTPDFQYLQSYI